jgi:hypothetical protein
MKSDSNTHPSFGLDRIKDLVGDDPEVINSIVQLFVREGTRIANEVSTAIDGQDIAMLRARLHELRPNLHNMGMDDALSSLEHFRSFIVDEQVVGEGQHVGHHMVALIRQGIEDMKIHLDNSSN